MDFSSIESSYSLAFRQHDIKALEEQLQLRHSVELVGMKRVGINSLLRFFLSHRQNQENNLIIFIDLNQLIEREIFPLWRLLFKRIVDAVDDTRFDDKLKQKIASLFDACIQSGDLFLTFDGVRESLVLLSQAGIMPTIFFSRFDRLAEVVTPEFFNNLQSLQDATNHKLAFVFTSFREMDKISPKAFDRKALALFSHVVYVKPADKEDALVSLSSFILRSHALITKTMKGKIIALAGGHTQYLQLLLIAYQENAERKLAEEEMIATISNDERITLQSEELWESLDTKEKEVLRKIIAKEDVSSQEREEAKYLWNTGFIEEKGKIVHIFSPLFAKYIEEQQMTKTAENSLVDFSKKEHLLFEHLKKNEGTICEREEIIEVVWPEYQEYGVSDWSVDRLVARVRGKLKKQKSPYEITTIRTRGYKLVTK